VGGDILLEDNDFGWQGDDSVNITGLLAPAQIDSIRSQSLLVEKRWWWHVSSLAVGSKVLLFDRGLWLLGQAEILTI
jgi:hypothetical protein